MTEQELKQANRLFKNMESQRKIIEETTRTLKIVRTKNMIVGCALFRNISELEIPISKESSIKFLEEYRDLSISNLDKMKADLKKL